MERMWPTRLRWRMRGAWQWPAFGLLTALDALLLEGLPVWGGGPGGIVPAALLAGFMNLLCVAVLAPLGGRLVRRRRPDLPRVVAADAAGTALLLAAALALLVAGLVHRPEVLAERDDRAAQAAAVMHYVSSQAPEYESGLGRLDTMRVSEDVYRTCVPGRDPKRWLCLFVETDQDPAGVTRDRDGAPNAVYQRHGGFE